MTSTWGGGCGVKVGGRCGVKVGEGCEEACGKVW